MRVNLRSKITEADLKALADIHRALQTLGSGMSPSSGYYPPLYAAMSTVKACGVEWSGRPDWRHEHHSIGAHPSAKSDAP